MSAYIQAKDETHTFDFVVRRVTAKHRLNLLYSVYAASKPWWKRSDAGSATSDCKPLVPECD